MMENIETQFLTTDGFARSDAERIAYKVNDGAKPVTFIWCGGLRSDMEGGKAIHLHGWAAENDYPYVRFDYYGHGESSGNFEVAHIGRWAEDVTAVIDNLTVGDVVLVGSSMGGWASLLTASRHERVKGLLLIAPAPDFTQKLMWEGFSPDIQNTILEQGVYYEPSPYGEPMPISKILIEESAKYQILDGPIKFSGPVRILQGMLDVPVPWQHALKIVDALESDNVEVTFVKDGDHSLSRPHDLERLVSVVESIAAQLTTDESP
ncbi:MAG: alpha/beta hydrolase [Maricaulaceae bacterium]